MTETVQSILNVTEDMIRQGGYQGFSFRNIADAIGIKSSSVHYHFETKEKLAEATTRRYTDNFIASLGKPEELKAQGTNPVTHYISAFRNAIIADKGMCLCGILGSETSVLPSSIVKELDNFFNENTAWLESAYEQINSTENVKEKALQTLSLLEGAMMIATTKSDLGFFDLSTKLILDEVSSVS